MGKQSTGSWFLPVELRLEKQVEVVGLSYPRDGGQPTEQGTPVDLLMKLKPWLPEKGLRSSARQFLLFYCFVISTQTTLGLGVQGIYSSRATCRCHQSRVTVEVGYGTSMGFLWLISSPSKTLFFLILFKGWEERRKEERERGREGGKEEMGDRGRRRREKERGERDMRGRGREQ